MVLIIPISVNARTQEEANAILDSFEDTIHLKSIVKPVALDEDETWDYSRNTAAYRLYFQRNYEELYDEGLCDDWITSEVSDHVTLSVPYTSNDGEKTATKLVNFIYDDIDETTKTKANNVIKEIPNKITLEGMNAINYLYHYGEIVFTDSSIKKSAAIFPGLKKIIEKHPEYEYEVIGDRGGGTPYFMERIIYIGLFKGDVLYGIKEICVDVESMILVDKEESGTLIERGEDRLKQYFNKENDFIINNNTIDNLPVEEIKEFTGLKDIYSGIVVQIKIGKYDDIISIVETNKETLDKIFVESSDILTGINVYTESIEVPLDSIVKTKDVLDEDYVKKAIEDNNLKLYKAFDIDLEKYSDKTLVKTIEDGLEVYIPTAKGAEGDKVLVYFIGEDGSKGDTIDGEIVKINNQLYVKFITNHLSTYAIDENVIAQNKTRNPKTNDNILVYIGYLFISLSSLLIANKKEI
jgi:hypothetical protein